MLLNLSVLVPILNRKAKRVFFVPLRCRWPRIVVVFLCLIHLTAKASIFLVTRRLLLSVTDTHRVSRSRIKLLVRTGGLMLALIIDALFSQWTFNQYLFHLTLLLRLVTVSFWHRCYDILFVLVERICLFLCQL